MFRILIIIVFVFSISLEFSFKPYAHVDNLSANDTTKVIELSIQKSFYRYNMPSLSTLTKKYKFGDSILFTAEKLSLKYLPQEVDSLKFKIMSKKNICSILLADPDWENRPHYLCIRHFERKGNIFDVIIVNENCEKYASGGGLGITIIKESDSFRVTHIGGFSIN